MTNPANSAVTCLNFGDIYSLFGPESTGIDTWSGADSLAQQVGGNGGFPDAPLEITAPGQESGTYDTFIELTGIEDTALSQGVPEDKAASLRSDYQASPDDNVIITAMEGSESSLGFVGFAYAEDAGDQIKDIEVDGGSGCVAPSSDTIADGSYPLSRPLFIYVNTDKAAASPAIQAFVDSYVSDTGLNTTVTDVGYIALPADEVAATQSAWSSANGS
jgi:phosphate transport system substrate-binding protein